MSSMLSAPAQTPPLKVGTLDTRCAHRPLTAQQHDAALNCVSASPHSKLTVLPNHTINPHGELEGFVFECCADDLANILPLTKSSFGTTAIYECLTNAGNTFLDLSINVAQKELGLVEAMDSLATECMEPLKFDCMPDWDNITNSPSGLKDQRSWREEIPSKIGVYHAFMRTAAQNMREHKIFIVVSGHCRHASEELYNLWLDARDHITAKQFMECAEVDWLRKTTMRHHNRLAARVAKHLKLSVRYLDDVDAVNTTSALLPTTSCVYRDMVLRGGRLLMSSDAVILEKCKSGIIFDCFASEGFWVFMGPRDTGSYKMFGMEMRSTDALGFPSKTVRLHRGFPAREKANVVLAPSVRNSRRNAAISTTPAQEQASFSFTCEMSDPVCSSGRVVYHQSNSPITGFLFPHSDFVHTLSKLGFNLNDGITNLMPIVTYCEDE